MKRLVQIASMLFVAFCIGTTLALGVVGGYAWLGGHFAPERTERVLAALHGLELPADAARAEPDPKPPADANDPAALRTRMQRDLELREQAVSAGLDHLRFLQKKLDEDRLRYDQLWAGFQEQLQSLREGTIAAGRNNVREIWENIRPKQAKDQILAMLKEPGGIDEVVSILSQMPIDRRARIVGEFKTEEEQQKLGEMLKLIRQGLPDAKLVDKTRAKLEDAKPN